MKNLDPEYIVITDPTISLVLTNGLNENRYQSDKQNY